VSGSRAACRHLQASCSLAHRACWIIDNGHVDTGHNGTGHVDDGQIEHGHIDTGILKFEPAVSAEAASDIHAE
jgi:hypothetical protein